MPLRALLGGALGLAIACASPRADSPRHAPETSRTPDQAGALPPGSGRVEAHAAARLPRKQHPWLGVEVGDPSPPGTGLPVRRVLAGSPAMQGGLSVGDSIVSVDGERLQRGSALGELVRAQPIGGILRLEIERARVTGFIEVPLEAAPDPEDVARLELVGRPAPEISGVVTFQGDVGSLRELEGRVVLLEFWASYCVACRSLARALDRLHVEYAGRGLAVLGVTVDPLELGAKVARRLGMTYSLASDPDATVTSRYMASAIPMLVLIDRRGQVREVVMGPSPERMLELEAELSRLLQEQT